MLKVAYLANQFPSAVEPYVSDEIEELRRRGVRVVAGSVRKTAKREPQADIVLQSLWPAILLRAIWLGIRRHRQVSDLIMKAIREGAHGPVALMKVLLHTWLGACYALTLREREVDHIHVHHGYFGSWIAMTAARLLDIGFSMSLHGSDLLLHGAYLDVKFANCSFCLTVSEYNRRYILEHYPEVDPRKILVARLGTEVPEQLRSADSNQRKQRLMLLAVGRLHAVKDHAFLIRACGRLAERGLEFECAIAGDGPEKVALQRSIQKLGLERQVALPGHVPRTQMPSLYERADVVVLTSRSEGIPLVLMEAMAHRRIVLAPAITGIPELIHHGRTGFLYAPGSLEDFVEQLIFIHSLLKAHGRSCVPSAAAETGPQLDWIRHAAFVQVLHNFNRTKNLQFFGDLFLRRVAPHTEGSIHEDFVLQQVQLPVQRYGSLSVRTDGVTAVAGARDGAVLDG